MLDFGFYNMDCMEGMKNFPDGFFEGQKEIMSALKLTRIITKQQKKDSKPKQHR